jgi:hypothetical protein
MITAFRASSCKGPPSCTGGGRFKKMTLGHHSVGLRRTADDIGVGAAWSPRTSGERR